jgi:hypothetical protein
VERTSYITKENVIEQLMTDELIVQSYVYSDKSAKYWKIICPINIKLITQDETIKVKSGFYYDMSTVPKWLWSIVRPYNDGLFGYLVHDHLYVVRTHGLSRKQCDQEMLEWTKLTNKNSFDNYFRYYVVRALGWLWWNKII